MKPFFYLRDDERVILRLRAAPSYAVALALVPTLALTAILVGVLVAMSLFPELGAVPSWSPWAAWGALVAVVAVASWRRAATSEYALTDERIYARAGRLVTRLHFTTHDKVTDIRYRQGPLERIFGLASLTFATAGAEVHVAGIRDAMQLKAASERARDAFVRTLLREAPARAAPAHDAPASHAGADTAEFSVVAARPAPLPHPVAPPWTGPRPDYLQAGDTPVWSGQPRPISAIGALRSLLGIIPLVIFASTMQEPGRAAVMVLGLGGILLFLFARLLALRRTEYIATDKRVYGRRGIIGTTVSQLTYDKITDITYSQDILGRILGYGTLTVQTAGSNQAPIVMHGLADALAAKETIERWRDASVGGR